MTIASSAFTDGGTIPARYTCQGEGYNPPLQFEHIPQETKSLILIIDDPDAPSRTFTHWVVYNMPPTTLQILENQIPQAQIGMNTAGDTAYAAPCPPQGLHHYEFQLYALDAMLDLTGSVSKEEIRVAMEGHIVDQAELIGIYQKTT